MDVDEPEDTSAAHQPQARRNSQRVLLLSSRGIPNRTRHLLKDLEALLPHTKRDSKLSAKSTNLIPELADLNNCNNCLYFESRHHEELYLWAAKTPNGPTVKMHVQNVHTMDELKMTGNCLKGSRGLVSFDKTFDSAEHWKLLKELFTQIFSVPPNSRRTKPFIDHILTFSVVDDKIWFRNYQVVEKETTQPDGSPPMSLVEIGPRFVLTPIRVFEGAFNGATIYTNKGFITPASIRISVRRDQAAKIRRRKHEAHEREVRKEARKLPDDELAVTKVFS
ncbi:Brix-domain-containing protein [Cantharellus anzutake]|uniref:Brix-domain-containing protein n=1 Tax=Cantharellus anzutake TaxID=1750568 RepID=UPI001904F2E4|nr:Brix-domain-containing protein [Cantharellus anzutake]KAF8334239.1 Brix-domain-containing protein [Cantharellus anzutake]